MTQLWPSAIAPKSSRIGPQTLTSRTPPRSWTSPPVPPGAHTYGRGSCAVAPPETPRSARTRGASAGEHRLWSGSRLKSGSAWRNGRGSWGVFTDSGKRLKPRDDEGHQQAPGVPGGEGDRARRARHASPRERHRSPSTPPGECRWDSMPTEPKVAGSNPAIPTHRDVAQRTERRWSRHPLVALRGARSPSALANAGETPSI